MKLSNSLIICAISALMFLGSCGNSGNNVAKESAVYTSVDEMVAAVKEQTTEITMGEFKNMYDGEDYFVMIDVRTVSEYDHGYIPGAVSIPRGVLEFRIASETVWDNFGLYIPEKTDPIIVYCKSGKRSVLAAKALQSLGFTDVKTLEEGWVKWHEDYPEMIEIIAVEEAGSGAMSSGSSDAGGC